MKESLRQISVYKSYLDPYHPWTTKDWIREFRTNFKTWQEAVWQAEDWASSARKVSH